MPFYIKALPLALSLMLSCQIVSAQQATAVQSVTIVIQYPQAKHISVSGFGLDRNPFPAPRRLQETLDATPYSRHHGALKLISTISSTSETYADLAWIKTDQEQRSSNQNGSPGKRDMRPTHHMLTLLAR